MQTSFSYWVEDRHPEYFDEAVTKKGKKDDPKGLGWGGRTALALGGAGLAAAVGANLGHSDMYNNFTDRARDTISTAMGHETPSQIAAKAAAERQRTQLGDELSRAKGELGSTKGTLDRIQRGERHAEVEYQREPSKRWTMNGGGSFQGRLVYFGDWAGHDTGKKYACFVNDTGATSYYTGNMLSDKSKAAIGAVANQEHEFATEDGQLFFTGKVRGYDPKTETVKVELTSTAPDGTPGGMLQPGGEHGNVFLKVSNLDRSDKMWLRQMFQGVGEYSPNTSFSNSTMAANR